MVVDVRTYITITHLNNTRKQLILRYYIIKIKHTKKPLTQNLKKRLIQPHRTAQQIIRTLNLPIIGNRNFPRTGGRIRIRGGHLQTIDQHDLVDFGNAAVWRVPVDETDARFSGTPGSPGSNGGRVRRVLFVDLLLKESESACYLGPC